MGVSASDLKKIKKLTDELLESLSVELSANVSANPDGVKIDLVGKDSAIIIGFHGETLADFSYILGQLLRNNIDLNERIKVDTSGYLESKDKKIKEMTQRVVDKVKKSGFPEDLEGLNAYERRIAHMVVEREGLISESTGFGKERKIIIKPKLVDEEE